MKTFDEKIDAKLPLKIFYKYTFLIKLFSNKPLLKTKLWFWVTKVLMVLIKLETLELKAMENKIDKDKLTKHWQNNGRPREKLKYEIVVYW